MARDPVCFLLPEASVVFILFTAKRQFTLQVITKNERRQQLVEPRMFELFRFWRLEEFPQRELCVLSEPPVELCCGILPMHTAVFGRAQAILDEESPSDEGGTVLLLTEPRSELLSEELGLQGKALRSQSTAERFHGEPTAVHEFMNSKQQDGLFAVSRSASPAGVQTSTEAAAATSCRPD